MRSALLALIVALGLAMQWASAQAPVPDPPRLANISTRGMVLTADDVMIGGLIIGGSLPKTVIVRARGPSLTQHGVPGVLANPQVRLYSGQTDIAFNDDWQDAANAADILASGFAPEDPREAAILMTLAPGAYTAIVTGASSSTGIAIVEVFEVDAHDVPLINISTRARVLTGDAVVIAGFIIQGSGPQTVVVRARGPSLSASGIAQPLANPILRLVRSSDNATIATNDDWGSAANVKEIFHSGFAPDDPRESAVLVTLDPGAYTAIVAGVENGTGVGIVEVFAAAAPMAVTYDFDFQSGPEGWEALFADYPAASTPAEQQQVDTFYELLARHSALPAPLDPSQGAMELHGHNHSDDLKMILKRRVTGLRPQTSYTFDFTVVLASNAPTGCAGVGGAPGESVVIKAGASTGEPSRVVGDSNHLRLTVDIGNQSTGGANGRVLGNFANSHPCFSGYSDYELITRSTAGLPPLDVQTDAEGGAWLLFATDSGFEGATRAYVDRITVTAR